MKYSYPKELQIGGHKIAVMLIDGYATNSDADNRGDYSPQHNEIRIATKTPEGSYRSITYINEAFHHEINEAIKDIFVLKIEHDDIERMAQGWLQVLSQLDIQLITESRTDSSTE